MANNTKDMQPGRTGRIAANLVWGAASLAVALTALPGAAMADSQDGSWQSRRGGQGEQRAERPAMRQGGNAQAAGRAWQNPGAGQGPVRSTRQPDTSGWQTRQSRPMQPAQPVARPADSGGSAQWQGRGGGDRRTERQDSATWQGRGDAQRQGQGQRQGTWNRDGDTGRQRDGDRSQTWQRDRDGDRTQTWQRDGNRSGTWTRDRDGDRAGVRRWTGDNRSWDRNAWRNNSRYDWSRYRDAHRDRYRVGRYYSPYQNYSYRRLGIGFTLGSLFYSERYWIDDPFYYRLPEVYGPYRWVRYYDDALLVDVYSGQVVDVIYDFFW